MLPGPGREKKARQALFRSLEYGEPRAEICCDIGALLMEEERYRDAIYWYELALSRKRQDDSGAFILPECYGYLPCIQLCVCYDRLGKFQKARDFNEKAGRSSRNPRHINSTRPIIKKFSQSRKKTACTAVRKMEYSKVSRAKPLKGSFCLKNHVEGA